LASLTALRLLGLLLLMVPAILGSSWAQRNEAEAFLPFLFAAYAVTWVAFFAYAFYVSRRQAELRREIDALRRALEERRGAGGPSKGPSADA
jgi:CcmD family protein